MNLISMRLSLLRRGEIDALAKSISYHSEFRNANSDKMMGKKPHRKTSQVVVYVACGIRIKCWHVHRCEGFHELETTTTTEKFRFQCIQMWSRSNVCSRLNFMRDLISAHCAIVRLLSVSPSIHLIATEHILIFTLHDNVSRVYVKKNMSMSVCHFHVCAPI